VYAGHNGFYVSCDSDISGRFNMVSLMEVAPAAIGYGEPVRAWCKIDAVLRSGPICPQVSYGLGSAGYSVSKPVTVM
jgi:hypothetical protein